MAEPKKQNFLMGASILAATTAIVKVIGAIYKIPLGNIIGDEGTAYFGIAYNIYSLLLTISTAGLPVALSRMISASNALGKNLQTRRTFVVARATFFTLGLLGSLLMLFFPKKLAIIMGSPNAEASIRTLAPAVVFVCLMSAYRGYEQGLSNMIPTSVSQIIEVMCKLVFGLSLAWLFSKTTLSLGAAGAIAGVTIGEIAAFLYVLFYKIRDDKLRRTPLSSPDVPMSHSETFLSLIKIAIPITIGSSLLNVIALIDTKLIIGRLQDAAGYSEEAATILYGAYFKVQTLYNLPAAFIVPMSISVVPAISAALAKKQAKDAAFTTEAAIKITNLLALPAGIGLSVLAGPIVHVIYPNCSPEAPGVLMILGIASFFVCLTIMTNAILQAYGHERLPVLTVPIGGIVKIILNWALLAIPALNVRGAALGTVGCYFVLSVFNLIFIAKKLPATPNLLKVFIRPAISTAIMGISAFLSFKLFFSITKSIFGSGRWIAEASAMCIAILAACIVYLIMIIAVKAITRDDLKLLPKGEKIANILKIL